MDTATRVQTLDEADCISHSTNTLGKGMNPIILPPLQCYNLLLSNDFSSFSAEGKLGLQVSHLLSFRGVILAYVHGAFVWCPLLRTPCFGCVLWLLNVDFRVTSREFILKGRWLVLLWLCPVVSEVFWGFWFSPKLWAASPCEATFLVSTLA